jgi:hypothetical protein
MAILAAAVADDRDLHWGTARIRHRTVTSAPARPGRRFATSPPDYGTLGDGSVTVRGGSRGSERLHVPPVLPPVRPLYVRNYPYTAHYGGTR